MYLFVAVAVAHQTPAGDIAHPAQQGVKFIGHFSISYGRQVIVYGSNLAPPLGELAPPPAVTERAKDVTTPPPSRLRRATSPKGGGKAPSAH